MPIKFYFEDFPVGETLEIGRHTITEAEILEFARRYDPQPFHVDADTARTSIYGGRPDGRPGRWPRRQAGSAR